MIELLSSNTLIRSVVLFVIFGVVVGGALFGLTFFNRRMTLRSELGRIATSQPEAAATESLNQRRDTAWEKLVDRIEQAGLDLSDSNPDQLRDRLRAAGFVSPSAPRIYSLVRLVGVIGTPLVLLLLIWVTGKDVSFFGLYLSGTIAALFGLLVPTLLVRTMADRRREEITNGFPDCLDLLLVCVEAGLGLESALDRVAREMAVSHPLVSNLLTTATLRLRAGATREETLRRMAEDAGVDEIRSFATLLIQSDKLGTSVATTLRVYAAEMRERRRMRAEEKAHRLPVLISIPLVAFMLPVMIGTLMIPAVVRVVRDLVPAMTGG